MPADCGQRAQARPQALLVEDSSDILTTTAIFLEAAGFDVARACSGDEALLPLASGTQFDLLVTDYAMPGLNGLDLAVYALHQLPDLKVLIITGFPGSNGLAELPPGVAALVKPFRRAQLIGQLQGWFGIRQAGLPEPGK
jgi:CheY-like chemotaxis protein